MALGTPTVGTLAFSALNGTSIAPGYPASIAANDIVVLFIGMKPSTANGGTVTTPTGWTLRDSITGQGGYGTTLGTDTGNTNLYVFTKDTVTGAETGNLTVTLGTNNVSWAVIVRVPGGGATSKRYGTADGGRATAPTTNVAFTNLLTNGTTPPNISAGDMVLFAMCCPTDVPAGNGFSAQTISSAGTTFATPVELRELFSATGNDISGYVAYASATSGSSTAAPTIGATVSTTSTNIRGPLVLISIRDTSQKLTPSRFDNTNSFFTPTVSHAGGTQTLTPARYNNTNTFYTPTVTKGAVTLNPARYDNTNTFYSATITRTGASQTLLPALYSNANTFFSPAITAAKTLTPNLYNNINVFYSPAVTTARGLLPALYSNTNTFYTQAVTSAALISPQLFTNTNQLFPPFVAQGTSLFPALYANTNTFYQVSTTYRISTQPYVEPGYVDDWYVGLNLQNTSQFFSPTVTIQGMSSGNMFSLFFP